MTSCSHVELSRHENLHHSCDRRSELYDVYVRGTLVLTSINTFPRSRSVRLHVKLSHFCSFKGNASLQCFALDFDQRPSVGEVVAGDVCLTGREPGASLA